MRRLGVIVALGTLLGMLGGVVAASPALARGPKWQFLPGDPFTLDASFCGFEVRVAAPVNKEYGKILKASDGSSVMLVTGSLRESFTNLSTGKTITANASGQAKITTSGRFVHGGGQGAQRAHRPHASRSKAVRAAGRERDRRCADDIGG
jgi:hypothetical protein